MRERQADQGNRIGMRALRRRAFLLAVSAWLAACNNTPVGVAPNLRGTYWEHALVTNPNGGGPQVVIWGPPEPAVIDHNWWW
jgi:hypothetical protein